MKKEIFLIALVSTCSLLFTACEKDDPVIPNEEELITTLNYQLTPTDGGSTVTLSFKDLDGDGGNAPTISGGTLLANKTYAGTLDLLNESETPAESITAEIAEEDEEHQFFFQTTISDLSITYTDQDASGNPVGLSSTLTTEAAGSGTITIILRHEPNKSASGVSGGDIANAGGETDIEVTFPLSVQ
jgi:hypothetical protein